MVAPLKPITEETVAAPYPRGHGLVAFIFVTGLDVECLHREMRVSVNVQLRGWIEVQALHII